MHDLAVSATNYLQFVSKDLYSNCLFRLDLFMPHPLGGGFDGQG